MTTHRRSQVGQNVDEQHIVRALNDLSSEALEGIRSWLEQNPPTIPARRVRGLDAAVAAFPFVEFAEQSDPAAPPANTAFLYARDNGAGKTQLVVRFPTGAVQVIATEP